jgi:hypothetical protein
MKPRLQPHAFVYRAGIGLAGTHITCDATGFPSDLIFLSHARALAPHGPAALSGARAGRRQIVTTEQLTLRCWATQARSCARAPCPRPFGRPFNLGDHRIEVVPTGYLPGAAALCVRAKSADFSIWAPSAPSRC